MPRILSVTRAGDRQEIARLVTELAQAYGAKTSRGDGALRGDRCIRINIEAPGGLCVGVDIDGASGLRDTHVLSWYMALHSDAKLDPSFGGNVNPHHFCKATYIAEGTQHLLELLARGLSKARDGSAYQQQRTVAN